MALEIGSLTGINDRTTKRAKQDQTAYTDGLILLYTLRKNKAMVETGSIMIKFLMFLSYIPEHLYITRAYKYTCRTNHVM